MPNFNPETGIAYGVIAANNLDPDLLQSLWYDCGVDLTYQDARKEMDRELRNEWERWTEQAQIAADEVDANMPEVDRESFIENWLEERTEWCDEESYVEHKLEKWNDCYECDEPVVAGSHDGVKYQLTWLGGAPILWVFEGPVGYCRSACSPCVPHAGDLDSGFTTEADGIHTYQCYVVPQDWLAKDVA